MNIHLFILIFHCLIILMGTENATLINYITLKFKTYYPTSKNSNNNEFSTYDYLNSIHFSKIYLELETGNETDFKLKTYQKLNTIIDNQELLFGTTDIYFKSNTKKNNDLLCTYNTSNSKTINITNYYTNIYRNKPLAGYAHDFFKIYTDETLSKYIIESLSFILTINHNISNICGNIGLTMKIDYHYGYHFIEQLHANFKIKDFSWSLKYKNNDEGLFIFGDNGYYENDDFVSFYTSNIRKWAFEINEITIDGKEITIHGSKEPFEVELSVEIEGIEFSDDFFRKIEEIFFENYYKQKICKCEQYKEEYKYSIIICDGEKFNENDIKKFPKIILNKYNKDGFVFNLEGKDLFEYKNRKYFFRILGTNNYNIYITMGRMFLRKYLTVFNPDKKLISFYKDKKDDKIEKYYRKKYSIIIFIFCILCVIICFPLGIYYGRKLYQTRKKLAFELNEEYYYQPKNENTHSMIEMSQKK